MQRAHKAPPKKTPRRRKRKALDPFKAQETARRIAELEARRQKIIEEVKISLREKREEKVAIQNGKLEKEAKAYLKEIRDAEKKGGEKAMLQIRTDMSEMIEVGVRCVYTSVIIPEKIKYDRKTLSIKGVKYKLNNNLHLVGWGKEAIMMSAAFERVVGKQLKRGFIVIPRKSIFLMWSFPEAFPKLDSHITYLEGGRDGLPDQKSVDAAARITEYCKKLKRRDILLVMLSKDVDDLLCYPRDTITLKDKLRLLQRLKKANATPEEINTVRNKLSAIRGGDLARLAYPAKVIVLITSDVSAEPTELLAGGPCSFDPKDETALKIVIKYKLHDRISQSVRELIEETIPWEAAADTQLDENKKYKFVTYYVIACNADAMECMSAEANKVGLLPLKLSSTCFGSIIEFAEEFAKLASLMILALEGKINMLEMYDLMKDSPVCPLSDRKVIEVFPTKDEMRLGLCLLLGGLPTREVLPKTAEGGPNQELALQFSLCWNKRIEMYPILRMYTVWFLGGSSTGYDGNTKTTGAFSYKSLTTDLYPLYTKIKRMYNTAHLKWWKMAEDKRQDTLTFIARQEARELERLKNMHSNILPDRVLKEHRTNVLYESINEGEELFEMKTGNYYTFTDVGNLYAIRIVRFECNCPGTCHNHGDRLCSDKECPINRTISAEADEKIEQYCCRVGSLKRIES